MSSQLNIKIAESLGWQWMERVGEKDAWLFSPDSKDVLTGRKGLFGEPISVRDGIVGPFRIAMTDAKKHGAAHNLPSYDSSPEAMISLINSLYKLRALVAITKESNGKFRAEVFILQTMIGMRVTVMNC